jgi:hypothetical protein
LTEAQRLVLKLYLEQIDILERHLADLDKSLAKALMPHQEAIERLCEIPGISVRTAQYIIAEAGPRAEAFAVAGKLASWAGMCPGQQESAGVSVSSRSAKGNWMLRRTLCQTAWAAIATKGSEAQRRFQRWRPRLGTQKAAWASRIIRYASYGKFSTTQFGTAALRVAGRWMYLFCAVDGSGQTVDSYVSKTRDREAARIFLKRALANPDNRPVRVLTRDRLLSYPAAFGNCRTKAMWSASAPLRE